MGKRKMPNTEDVTLFSAVESGAENSESTKTETLPHTMPVVPPIVGVIPPLTPATAAITGATAVPPPNPEAAPIDEPTQTVLASSFAPVGATINASPPNFLDLLSNPLVKDKLPSDFSAQDESKHLLDVWNKSIAFKKYLIEVFVHAGGSGMVFKAIDSESQSVRALKIARKKLFCSSDPSASLSPVSPTELMGLERVSHPNAVRLYEALEIDGKTYGIATTYIDNPLPIDSYIRSTLEKRPDRSMTSSESLTTTDRLSPACVFIAHRFIEVAQALSHMHEKQVFHFDVKPANILIGGRIAYLTDMGASVHGHQLNDPSPLRVHFSWAYAHPDLTTISSDPASISGGGLKASALIRTDSNIARFDLYSFGKSLLEILGILEIEFGEKCYSTYAFKYLHLIAALLLDGRNQISGNHDETLRGVRIHDRYFVSDVALDFPVEILARHAISSATELAERLLRMPGVGAWQIGVPELTLTQNQSINLGDGAYAPYTSRIRQIAEHPTFKRLTRESQLGWVSEVYPGATHNRWSHSLGVFSCLTHYYRRLLDDSESPALLILLDASDIEHALIAGLLHDLGQTAFGHDFEAAGQGTPDHKYLVKKLLFDPNFAKSTLADTICANFRVDINRVLAIIGTMAETPILRPVDGIAKDCIDGPIDADKLDYTHRDSVHCGVSYGLAVDRERFLQSLTVAPARGKGGQWELALAYKSKGRPAIESLLIARYQLYGSVYWHHTFRCMQAMFVHAVGLAFGKDGPIARTDSSAKGRPTIPKSTLDMLFYHLVICRRPWEKSIVQPKLKNRKISKEALEAIPPEDVRAEPILEYVWRFSEPAGRELIEMLAGRKLFKRIFEVRAGAMGRSGMYKEIRAAFPPNKRVAVAHLIQNALFDAIQKKLLTRSGTAGVTEESAKRRYEELANANDELVVVDFPVRGISLEDNVPTEVMDHERKYFVIDRGDSAQDDDVFFSMRNLQERTAMFRIYVHSDFHGVIARYLKAIDIRTCVEEFVPGLRRRR